MRKFINNQELLGLLEIDVIDQGITKVTIICDHGVMPRCIIEKLIKVDAEKLKPREPFDWLALINSGISHRQLLSIIKSKNS